MTPVEPTSTGCRIRVRAQPRARVSETGGVHGDALRVRLAAPPVDGAANDELVRFLAERLGVARRQVELARGAGTRDKLVVVTGVTAEDASRKLGL